MTMVFGLIVVSQRTKSLVIPNSCELLEKVRDRDELGVRVQLSVVNIPGSVKNHLQGLVLNHLKLSHVYGCCVLRDRSCVRHSRADYRYR